MNEHAYADSAIEEFIGKRSRSIGEKIDQIFGFDIVLKLVVAASLVGNAYLYRDSSNVVLACGGAVLLLLSLVYFEIRSKRGFRRLTKPNQDTRQILASMVAFLENRFNTSTFSISSTYIFFFLSGLFAYFYFVYGRIRPLDNMDIFVFAVLCFIGVAMNFAVTKGQTKYFVKHLKTCLSDLNEDILAVVSSNIETQQKQDKVIKVLLGLLAILGFVVLVAVLKQVAG